MRNQINEFTSTAVENFTTTSDRVLDAILDGNHKAVDVWVKTADQVVEQLPEMPWAESVPTPAEAGTSYLDFVERAVEANRDFNRRVAEMLSADPVVAAKDAQENVTKVVKDAQGTATKAAKDAQDRVTNAMKDAQERITATVQPAPAPNKTVAKKATTAKKTVAKKATAKKTVAKKTATAKTSATPKS